MILPPLDLPGLAQRVIGHVFDAMAIVLQKRIRLSDIGAGAGLSPASRVQNIALHAKVQRMWQQFEGVLVRALAGKLQVRRTVAASEGGEASGETGPGETGPGETGAGETGSGATGSGERTQPAARKQPEPKPGVRPKPCRFGEHWITATHPSAMPAYPTRGFGWMCRFIPAHEQAYFRERFTRPTVVTELTTLCHVSSTAARVMRSLCHGMGVVAPAGMFPKATPRTSRARPRSEHTRRRPRVTPDGRAMPRSMLRTQEIVVPAGYRDRQWVKIRAEQRAAAALPQDAGVLMPAGVRRAKS